MRKRIRSIAPAVPTKQRQGRITQGSERVGGSALSGMPGILAI
jgi:hypothetical protein